MSDVGLLYVGAVLLLNGLVLLGRVPARAAAALNLLVGALQCVTPTVLIIQADGNADAVLAASGLYLFGFTYLYVGIGALAGLEPEGIGWFSLFVAGAAVVYAGISFFRNGDPVFGVIWLAWALLWALFFLVFGLGEQRLTRFTGWAVVLLSQPTCTVPAFLAMTGSLRSDAGTGVLAAVLAVALVALAAVLASRASFVPQPVLAKES
ncbi:AmiS/UreI family transporter [Actinosynnema sp. NPDC047251]|uniref:Putative transporter protein n=1 Tax=Saccharothrix espanaensis (strain ATCC 51144 / DSM 44229 / JCM 9112 / NBRC 15066 / NRRL 15764) TaxID=1179773 RepID=K0JTY4_SACES|nr:AmiS/UreI family transporter [Saccharothrix espanaensis]CCH31265.1 putative transporter protein [Saccharothrix espanaensis DSM 44229]